MHPAYSVIFFTTASGAGYGLLFWLGVLDAAGLLPVGRWVVAVALAVSLVLITAGLLSSTFHLGHPERAWRAFSQWRSSWLSREGVASVITYAPAILYGWGRVVMDEVGAPWAVLALLAALGAVATVVCTGQIYASLKAIPRWHHPLVTPIYLALAGATGALLLDMLLRLAGEGNALVSEMSLALLAISAALKLAYWRAIDNAPPTATVESATGLGRLGVATMLDPPHTSANYLQTEMGFKIARKHAAKLRRISLALLFVLPGLGVALALAMPAAGAVFAALALLSAAAGVFAERWLFFAEAQHVVTLYYGDRAV